MGKVCTSQVTTQPNFDLRFLKVETCLVFEFGLWFGCDRAVSLSSLEGKIVCTGVTNIYVPIKVYFWHYINSMFTMLHFLSSRMLSSFSVCYKHMACLLFLPCQLFFVFKLYPWLMKAYILDFSAIFLHHVFKSCILFARPIKSPCLIQHSVHVKAEYNAVNYRYDPSEPWVQSCSVVTQES